MIDEKETHIPGVPGRRRTVLQRLAGWKWAVETLNGTVQMVAIVAAGVWAFYTFIYQDQIKPASEPPVLVITNTLEKAGQKGNIVSVRVATTIRNTGKTWLRILSYTTNVEGIKIQTGKKASSSTVDGPKNALEPNHLATMKYFKAASQEVLFSEGVLLKNASENSAPSISLYPGEVMAVIDQLVYIDKSTFDSLQLNVFFWFTKTEGRLISMHIQKNADGSVFVDPPDGCPNTSQICPISTFYNSRLSLW